jgi:ABC-type Fe3+/spermidine/putrescine transport system ATPase subunit
MHSGTLEQVGPPEQVYRLPETQFVADFVGHSNLPQVQVGADGRVELAGFPIPLAGSHPAGAARLFCRPEDLQIGSWDGIDGHGLMAQVESLEFLGPIRRVTLRLERAREILLNVDLNSKDPGIREGERVPVRFPAERMRLFTETRA